jgi:cobalt/nickel transport system permease protein
VHIADGILPTGFCIAAQAVALGGVSFLGRKIEPEEVVRMGLMSSAVFVVSMVHFPIGGTSIHLGLAGLAGILLGRRAFPVIYATLLFQALLFQHGGLLALGVNAINMGLGAMAAAAIWKAQAIPESPRAVLAGFAATLLPATLMAVEFYCAGYGKGFGAIAGVYSVVALMEGAVTSFIIQFLRRVKPAVLSRAAA